MVRLVGPAKARELCYTGRIFGAQEALAMGLVNQVLPDKELHRAVEQTAHKIAAFGRVALRAIKTSINQGFDLPLDRAIPRDAEHIGICFSSPDRKEGMEAFLEKRKPEFKGEA